MAEEKGNDALWNHVVDLHRKHADLQMQMHDKQGESGEGMQAMQSAVTELTSAIKELITVMKNDVKADKGENGSGKRKQPGA